MSRVDLDDVLGSMNNAEIALSKVRDYILIRVAEDENLSQEQRDVLEDVLDVLDEETKDIY